MNNNTHPSNLKVRRLTELPQIPQEEIGESVLYATANNKDYKVGTTTYVDAVVEQLGDELAGIGEVRDEAVEARNDAVVASGAAAASASEAASSATAAEQHAEDSESCASAAEESANLAEQARLSGPPIGYSTRAEMEGNTGEDEGALALVTNDPIPDNNGTWRWSGTAWVQSADRVSGLEAALGGRTYRDFENIGTSSKNLFDPSAVITGYFYRSDGTVRANAGYRVTPKYPVAAGQKVAISGLDEAMLSGVDRHINFWNGETHIAAVGYPAANTGRGWMVVDVPSGATGISLNLSAVSNPLPPKLQVEIAAMPAEYEPARKPETALPVSQFDNLHFRKSTKNLFDGRLFQRNVTDTQVATYVGPERLATSFIPVEVGKTYTISGLDPSITGNSRVAGVGDVKVLPTPVTELFGNYSASSFTFSVTNPATKFVAVSVTNSAARYLEAYKLRIQVEEGPVATDYEPQQSVRGIEPSLRALRDELVGYTDDAVRDLIPTQVSEFDRLGFAGPTATFSPVSRFHAPAGAGYRQKGVDDAAGEVLYTKVSGLKPGTRSVSAFVACFDDADVSTLPKVAVVPFNVPSGMLVHEGPSTLGADYGKSHAVDDFVHPAIAYDAAGVAGYKYWMVASILPGYSTGGATWEDEDIFVSNDAINWLRIKSLYEPSRADHAPGLSLPPHDLVASGGRRYGFLPCPAAGDTIEVSTPASQWGPALDRENITLSGTPWKHDPAILIHSGYVYIYHTFHLSYAARDGGKNKFIVCTRTNDGVNWECIRSDGSTLPLTTAAASRQMFTKDASDRYNYLTYYLPGQNPEVIKYGAGDFELVYGSNFSHRYPGTTPWSFDFGTTLPVQGTASGNHPGLLLAGGTLYLLNQDGLFSSTNRGQSFTELSYSPAWRGGTTGSTYKKALCVGEGGKVIVADVAAIRVSAATLQSAPTQYMATMRRNKMFLQHFSSVAGLVGYANSGLRDAYIDVQIDQVNYAAGTRKSIFVPYVGNTALTTSVNTPHQRVPVTSLEVGAGDVLHVYVALNSRTGGRVDFNGLEIE